MVYVAAADPNPASIISRIFLLSGRFAEMAIMNPIITRAAPAAAIESGRDASIGRLSR